MLKSLSVNNYLLIDSINLDFGSGFSVITGETGAGKSIMLGALSLLLGKRADTDVLTDKSKKCVVEATFNLDQQTFMPLFEQNDADFETSTVLRREILPEGKSRAFVNDSPVNLTVLKNIGEKLIDIHTQHENLALGMMSFRTQIIDIAAGTVLDAVEYAKIYNNFQLAENQVRELKKKLAEAQKETDFYRFQAEQIAAASIGDENELEELEEQSSLLENAVEIKESLLNALNIATESEFSAEERLKSIKSVISKISGKYKQGVQIAERLDSIIIELKYIYSQLENDADKAETNPRLLESINDRIDLINKLLQKHQVSNIRELKEKYNSYVSFISNCDNLEQEIKDKQTEVVELEKQVVKSATELSLRRQKSFAGAESEIDAMLKDLGIAHAVFKINNEKSSTPGPQGFDNISFLFSANKSVSPQPIEKVASGGEFSRLMLALKSLVAGAAAIPTIIFDEIDTGVSGEIASKMGKIMSRLSANFQVISITHLPQVAATGQKHYKVYKYTDDKRSYTKIKQLDSEERVNEIASMISGEKLSIQAIENARILLEN
ncbi:MAG: DNA repair protein RecN [Bacteroidales bacterium]|nr:DNA repair protein RecN [Bacteroidales bacterium]